MVMKMFSAEFNFPLVGEYLDLFLQHANDSNADITMEEKSLLKAARFALKWIPNVQVSLVVS